MVHQTEDELYPVYLSVGDADRGTRNWMIFVESHKAWPP